jgi:hypothetical protein
MRVLAAIIISLSILLGVQAFLHFASGQRTRSVATPELVPAKGHYSGEITLTFTAEADSFALDATSLLLKQQSHVLLKRDGRVPAGEPIVIENLTTVTEGLNEFYLECMPLDDGQAISRAVRLQIFRDGEAVADQTFWSPPGQIPRGTLKLMVPPAKPTEAPHDHT